VCDGSGTELLLTTQTTTSAMMTTLLTKEGEGVTGEGKRKSCPALTAP
jgi:hypothetical protein